MKDFHAIVPARDKWCSIVWQVNDVCNFRCPYCNEWNWGGRHKNDDTNTIRETLDAILKHYKARGYRYFKLFLSGGEPTFWKPLVPVVEHFRASVEWPGSCVGVNTNFSRPLAWWQEYHHLFEDVVATYHPHSTSDDKYVENYKFLQDKKGYLCARVMMQRDRFQQCMDFSARLKRECFNYMIEHAPVYDELRPSTQPFHYDEEWQIEFLQKHSTERAAAAPVRRDPVYAYSKVAYEDGTVLPINTNEIITSRKNFFRGWKCNIHESLHIHPDGRIQMASCGVGPIIGNIVKGRFEPVLEDAIVCPKDHCHCAADFNITKSRSDSAHSVARAGYTYSAPQAHA